MTGLVAWALMAAGWICLLTDVARLHITGLAVLGAALILIALWILGVFTRTFWNQHHTPRSKK